METSKICKSVINMIVGLALVVIAIKAENIDDAWRVILGVLGIAALFTATE